MKGRHFGKTIMAGSARFGAATMDLSGSARLGAATMDLSGLARLGAAITLLCLATAALAADSAGQSPRGGNSAAPTAASAPQGGAASPSVLPVPPARVVDYVSRAVDWYRRTVALQELPADPDEMVLRSRLSQTALTGVQLAFDFGRAAASLAAKAREATAAPAEPGLAGNLDRAAAQLASRNATLQSQLDTLNQRIAHASRAERSTLTAQRDEVAAALELTKEFQRTVSEIERFEESSDTYGGAGSSGLAAQIADLQRSVPEARRAPPPGHDASEGAEAATKGTAAAPPPATPAGPSSASSPPAGAVRPESAGVVALAGEWFSLNGTLRQLTDATKQTDALLREDDAMRAALLQGVRALARQNPLSTPTDPAQLAQARQQFEAATTLFKQLSTLLVPVGEQGITLESARNLLVEWRNSVEARSGSVARYLALRAGILLGSVVLVLAISDIWRRATFRYLHDSRRRRQFLALRRVVVGVALALVVIFGLVSEVGSVATYAGLITAGLAVALQNVILAVVAYFFLIGRYGVRVGDRVTLAGVTGRVVDIGLVRIYLMELTGPELRSSGRMVVLSNAVLFQPTALFKQMPGGDFFWHTIVLTLAPTTDVQSAQTRLMAAADSVYENYRPAIERQHAALQRFIDFETAMPRPEVYVRLSEKGLECMVRYPVEPARAASIDQKMLVALRQAQAQEPALELVAGPVLHTES